MRLTIEQAPIGLQTPCTGEVGCIIVYTGEVADAEPNESEMPHD